MIDRSYIYNNFKLFNLEYDLRRKERVNFLIKDLLQTADQKGVGGLCVYLDKTSSLISVFSFLYSLSKFRSKLPSLAAGFIKDNFEKGDKIRVLPSGHIFEYEGLHPKYDQFFWLKVINQQANRTIPINEALRFERTDRTRPLGSLNTKIPPLYRSLIDHYLGGLSTYGNKDLFDTEIFLLGNRTKFLNSFNSIRVLPNKKIILGNEVPTMGQLMDVGHFSKEGELIAPDRTQVNEQPLISISNSVTKLFNYIIDKEINGRLIVLDGVPKEEIDPYYLKPAMENNLVLAIASREEIFSSYKLTDLGFELYMPNEEKILKDINSKKNLSGTVLGTSLAMLNNRNKLEIQFSLASWEKLEKIYGSI